MNFNYNIAIRFNDCFNGKCYCDKPCPTVRCMNGDCENNAKELSALDNFTPFCSKCNRNIKAKFDCFAFSRH